MYPMHRSHIVPSLLTAAFLVGSGCKPALVTPEHARDRMYDHLARAEAYQQDRMFQAANYQRERATEYQKMISEGRTITPQQALLEAAQHRHRADVLQNLGYTRFVPQELEKAAMLEEFAVRAGGLTREQAERSAEQHLRKAAEYESRELRQFARHYRDQASKLRRAVWDR